MKRMPILDPAVRRRPTLFMALLLGGTVLGAAQADAQLRLWTIEEQPERLARQEAAAAAFEAETGISVDVIPVTESQMSVRATAALAAGDLPDVIYHPLPYVLPWTEAGILDPEAATEAIDLLDPATFAPGALAMAAVDDGYAAVPVDGWTQMVLYRADLFEEAGLEPPTTFAAIEAAIDALHSPPDMYGFVAATKVDEDFMSQVLEHVFLANGVSPVDEDGLRPLDQAATLEVLDFYRRLAEASPPGELFWQQSRELYLAGRAAMIIWSPFILDELAGLRDSAPVTIGDDPTSDALAAATGVVTTLSGPSNPDGAAWASLSYFGITVDADYDAAVQFVAFSMDQTYAETLAIAPEGKFPIRRGTPDDPDRFVETWSQLPVGVDRFAPLSELYPAEVIQDIVTGLETADRWGAAEGQLALASRIVSSQVLNRLVREYIDGVRGGPETVALMNEELAALQ